MSQNPHSRFLRGAPGKAESVPFFHATHHIAEPRVGHRHHVGATRDHVWAAATTRGATRGVEACAGMKKRDERKHSLPAFSGGEGRPQREDFGSSFYLINTEEYLRQNAGLGARTRKGTPHHSFFSAEVESELSQDFFSC